MANEKVIASYLKKFSIVFPGKEMSEELVVLYAGFLKDVSDEVFSKACDECIKTLKFFPTIAEIIEKSKEIGFEKRNIGSEFFSVWRGGSIPEDDAFYEALESIGGTRILRESNVQEMGFLRREFMKEYNYFKSHGLGKPLISKAEMDRQLKESFNKFIESGEINEPNTKNN